MSNGNSNSLMSNDSPSCQWKVFKGTECGYAGAAATCDRSYQRCVDLGNEANFGGFRWLPSIQDKPICTYSAGYSYARWVDEQGEVEKGPRREDYIPDTPFTSLMRACGYDPDAAVFWQGYCEYWSDRGVME